MSNYVPHFLYFRIRSRIYNKQWFNKSTVGPIITIAFSFILLIIACFKFTEAHSKQFNMTSMQMFGDGILSDDESVRDSNNSNGEEYSRDVRRKTLI